MVLGDGMKVESKLVKELEKTLVMIDNQIKFIMKDAALNGQDPYELKHIDGTYVLSRLLTARAEALNALVFCSPSMVLQLPSQNPMTVSQKTRLMRMFNKERRNEQ